MSALEFEQIRDGNDAGRPSIRATTRRRDDALLPGAEVLALVKFAEWIELAVDAERGILLRTESQYGGEPISSTEGTRISFDHRIDDEVFVVE